MSTTAHQHDSTARLTVVVPADRPATLRRMRDALLRQSARDALEVVVVRWPEAAREPVALDGDGFAALQVIDVAAATPLPAGRAAGVRAARTPLVFCAETHAWPHPDWAARVLDAVAGGRGEVVASSFVNANPDGPVSWAGFLLDYGGYADDLPAREIGSAPIHKGAYPRDALLAFGERLPCALSSGDELPLALAERGLRTWFEPGARIDHVNVGRLAPWLRGRFLIGFLIGVNRAERWSRWRRALYVVLAPAIAALLAWRGVPIYRRVARTTPLPRGTAAAMAAGAIARAAGEAIAYAGGAVPALQHRADAYELHESVHAGIAPP